MYSNNEILQSAIPEFELTITPTPRINATKMHHSNSFTIDENVQESFQPPKNTVCKNYYIL